MGAVGSKILIWQLMAGLALASACGGGDGDGSGIAADGGGWSDSDVDEEDLEPFVPPQVLFTCNGEPFIYRLADRNGDLDFHDPDEESLFADLTSLYEKNLSIEGLVAIDDSTLLAGLRVHSTLLGELGGMVAWVEDANGDGDALDPDETRMWYSGALAEEDLVDRLSMLVGTDGTTVVFFDNSTGDSPNALYSLEDVNGDGDADDAGEIELVANMEGQPFPADMVSAGGYLWFTSYTEEGLYRIEDGVVVKVLDKDALLASRSYTFYTSFAAAPNGALYLQGLSKPNQMTFDNAFIRVNDLNDDGAIDFATETDLVQSGSDYDLHLNADHPFMLTDQTFIAEDSGREILYMLQDRNGDGLFRHAFEFTVLFDFATAADNGSSMDLGVAVVVGVATPTE